MGDPPLDMVRNCIDALDLLEEWLKTPFFESRKEWENWVKVFRPKVKAVLRRDGREP